MRAIRQHRFGGPEVLLLEHSPDPVPSPGQVRVAVAAAGVHLLDTSIRAGQQGGPFPVPDLPMTPGREVAGTVDAVAAGVDPGWLGRGVVAHLGQASGGYASAAVVPVEALIPLPAAVDPAEAVAMVGTGRTTLGVLHEAALRADDVVLITAAAGGIGALLVQAAGEIGARTIGAAGGGEKVAVVRSLGAAVAPDYTREGWADRLRDERVTVALDGVGGAVGRAAFDSIVPGGRMVLFGYSSGAPFGLCGEDLFSHGVAVSAAIGPRMFARPGGIQALAEEAVARLAAGRWRPLVTRFPLEEAAAAHTALSDRQTVGKVVLVP